MKPVTMNECRSDNSPEDRTPVVTAARAPRSPVLRKTRPQLSSRAGPYCVRSDTNYSRSCSGVASVLAFLKEEVDAALRPIYSTGALGKCPGSANLLLQLIESQI